MGDLQGENLFQSLGSFGQDSHKTQEIMYAVKELRRLSMARDSIKQLDNAMVLLQRTSCQTEEIIDGTIEKLSEIARKSDELDEQGVTHFEAARQALAELGGDSGPKIYTDVGRLDQWTSGPGASGLGSL